MKKELPRGSETILVVEDEETVRKLTVRVLQEQVKEGSRGLKIKLNKNGFMHQKMTSLWQYVPLDKYLRPAEPVSEVARSGFKAFWNKLRGAKSIASSVNVQVELRSIPPVLLSALLT